MPALTLTIDATQWFPGVEIPGVEPELTEMKGGEPEVTHGLMLLAGQKPIQLKDKDGNPTTAKVGDKVCRRAHVTYPDGHSDVVLPGDWIVKNGDALTVLSPEEFAATYPQVTTIVTSNKDHLA